jgi:glycosyltransferase involved in cell wall biosynthesis
MRVLVVNSADHGGGAARAAYRLLGALRASGMDCRMLVRTKRTDHPAVQAAGTWSATPRAMLGQTLLHLQRAPDSGWRSANMLPSRWARLINESDADVVNVHWLGEETMSIADIGGIRKPVVWTLHDMWAFCGTEHYASEGSAARWKTGYNASNRPLAHRGIDLDRRTWERKLRAWQRPWQLVAPSRWLAGCASASRLLAKWPCATVPNVLDTRLFAPVERDLARRALGLEPGDRVVLFGAHQAREDTRKGFDLLRRALADLRRRDGAAAPLACLAFGQAEPAGTADPQIRWLGRIDDDARLAALYSAADVMVVPSRLENLPQTATEAQACGCPVVAFATGGLPDAVEDRATGYLAHPFDVTDLAEGVRWVLSDRQRHESLRRQARERAQRLWSPEAVVPSYVEVFAAAASSRSQQVALP